MTNSCGGDTDNDETPTATSNGPALTPAVSLAAGPVFIGVDPVDTLTAIAVGDFNGDGEADLALGAAFADGVDNAQVDAGEVYVFLSVADTSGEIPGSRADLVMTGTQAGEQAGRSLATTDFNGDGTDDLVIGAPAADADTERSESGLVYIIPGDPRFETRPRELDPPQEVTISGADGGDYFGYSLAAGDFDGDGADDLAVGAFLGDGPDDERDNGGEAYVFHGGGAPRSRDLGEGSGDTTIYGADAGDHLGETVSAGDFDGDGREDLVAVATFGDGPDNEPEADVGEVYVLTGALEGEIDLADGVPGVTVVGVDDGDQLGHSAASLDFNGDGFADLLLGAVSADGVDNSADLAGEVALVMGTNSPPARIAVGDGDVPVLYGDAGGRLGRSVAAGDLDGDGYGDALLAAPETKNASGAVEAGAAFVIFGGPDAGFPQTVPGDSLAIYGRAAGNNLATQVNGNPSMLLAELNGDGLDDVIISASRASEKRGEVMVYYAEAMAE